MTEEMNGVTWKQLAEDETARVIVGGIPEGITLEEWPHYHGATLPYFGCVTLESGRVIHLFLNDQGENSFAFEGGANCALITDGESPYWVDLHAVFSAPTISVNRYGSNEEEEGPIWLQGDETPSGYSFVASIPSQVDGGNEIVIDGYGTAYVFVNDDQTEARMLWQS